MEVLPLHVFKHSFNPIIKLLNEHDVKYQIREQRSGVAMASSGAIEIIVNASIWVSLASIIITFIRAKNNRSVQITTKDGDVIHAEGLDSKQLKKVLEQAKEVIAIDRGKK